MINEYKITKNQAINLIILGFLVCTTAFAVDQSIADKKALQQPDSHVKIDGCCKICKTDKSKPCGNSCIPIGEECGKGKGCACTSDGKHELEEKPVWVAPK